MASGKLVYRQFAKRSYCRSLYENGRENLARSMMTLDWTFSSQRMFKCQASVRVFEKGYIALVVGAKFATKRIPDGKLRALVEMLDFPVVLIGGPEDAACGQRLTIRADVFNACGKFSLLQSARLLQHARLIITPDTGMMHIASAFHRPIISIWGSTIPEFGMAPYMPLKTDHHSILEQKGLSCRPCSKIGFSKCPKGHFNCMEQLETQTIITTVNKILTK
jgi:ADP-heptose:LPS heptosyltransferase